MPDLNPNHVTCPQKRRTTTRRKNKSKIYQTKEWKAQKAEFVKGKVCEWCGATEKLLPHHPYQNTQDEAYTDLFLSGCIVLCSTCHFMFHKRHKRRCSVCKVGWRRLDTEMCWDCYLKENPDKLEEIEVKKIRKRKKQRVLRSDQKKRITAEKVKNGGKSNGKV